MLGDWWQRIGRGDQGPGDGGTVLRVFGVIVLSVHGTCCARAPRRLYACLLGQDFSIFSWDSAVFEVLISKLFE